MICLVIFYYTSIRFFFFLFSLFFYVMNMLNEHWFDRIVEHSCFCFFFSYNSSIVLDPKFDSRRVVWCSSEVTYIQTIRQDCETAPSQSPGASPANRLDQALTSKTVLVLEDQMGSYIFKNRMLILILIILTFLSLDHCLIKLYFIFALWWTLSDLTQRNQPSDWSARPHGWDCNRWGPQRFSTSRF